MMKAQILHELLQMRGNNHISFQEMSYLFIHSLILGSCLTGQSFYFGRLVDRLGKGKEAPLADYLLGASNILFLCVGLTGIMILVDNNLARALSIGATLALTRFRVKLGQKNLGANLLFGIIVGVSCGVGEIKVAWLVSLLYIILENFLIFFLKISHRRSNKELFLTHSAESSKEDE